MCLYDCEMKYLLRKGLLSVACSFESSCQVSLGDSPLTCVVNIDLNSKCDGYRDIKWSNSTIIYTCMSTVWKPIGAKTRYILQWMKCVSHKKRCIGYLNLIGWKRYPTVYPGLNM